MKFIFGQAKRKNEFYLAIKGRIQPDIYKNNPPVGKEKINQMSSRQKHLWAIIAVIAVNLEIIDPFFLCVIILTLLRIE